jgi:hypothetical protein
MNNNVTNTLFKHFLSAGWMALAFSFRYNDIYMACVSIGPHHSHHNCLEDADDPREGPLGRVGERSTI